MSGLAELLAGMEREQALINAQDNVGVNPDHEANVYRKARRVDLPVGVARMDEEMLDKRLAGAYAADPRWSPAVRALLADRDRSRLVANEPEEFERLSGIHRIGLGIMSGVHTTRQKWYHGDIEDAASRIQGGKSEARDLIKSTEQTEDALFSGEDFLDKWGKRPDSPLVQKEVADAKADYAEAITKFIEATKDQAALPSPRSLEYLSDAKNFTDALDIIASDPTGTMLYTAAQSVTSLSPYMLAAMPLYAIPKVGPALGAAMIGKGSYDLEYLGAMMNALTEEGVNFTNAESIQKAYLDPELMTRVREKARKRAAIVGAFDFAAGLAAPFELKPVTGAIRAVRAIRGIQTASRAARPTTHHVENMLTQMTVGSALGAGGEATAQIATGEEFQVGEVVLEAVAEWVGAPADVIAARAAVRRQAVEQKAKTINAAGAAQSLAQLAETAKESTLAKRDEGEFTKVAAASLKGTAVENTWLRSDDMKTLGIRDSLVEVMPELTDRVRLAEATGGDVQITGAEFMTLAARDNELAVLLTEHLRSDENGFTQAEAQSLNAKESENFAATVAKLAEAQGQSASRRVEAAEAVLPLKEKLRATGMSGEEADANVALQQALVESLSEKLGVSPKELVERHGVNVAAADSISDFEASGALDSFHEDVAPDGTPVKGGEPTTLGAYYPKQGLVALFKESNASTFVHEMAHHWLDAMAKIGDSLALRVENGEVLTEGEQEFYRLLGDFMAWGGVLEEGEDVATAIHKWNKLTPDGQRQFQEQFARGFEAYMLTGKAPKAGLHGVFAQFSAWLKKVYSSIAELGVELSPDVQLLYDRLLVSTDAINSVEEMSEQTNLFDDIVAKYLTPAENEKYKQARQDTTDEAEASINARLARDARLIHNRRIREERGLQREYDDMVQTELEKIEDQKGFKVKAAFSRNGLVVNEGDFLKVKMNQEEAQKVLSKDAYEYAKRHHYLTSGEDGISPSAAASKLGYDSAENMMSDVMSLPSDAKDQPGNKVRSAFSKRGLPLGEPNILKVKMRRDVAKAVLSKEAYNYASKHHYLVDGKEGYAPDSVATMFGYDSADEMMTDVMSLPANPRELATERADEAFLAKYGEAADKKTIARMASEAVHNEARSVVLATEQAALAKITGSKRIMLSVAKKFAESAIGRLALNEVRPGVYENAEAQARKKAAAALQKGDFKLAAMYKQNELIQNTLARAAYEALDKRDAMVREHRRTINSKTIEPSYLTQIRQLGAMFALPGSKKVSTGERTLVEFLREEVEPLGINLGLPDWMLAPNYGAALNDLTVDQMAELSGALTALATLGRKVHKLNALETKNTVEEAVNALHEAVSEQLEAKGRADQTAKDRDASYLADTGFRNVVSSVKGFLFTHLRVRALARIIDGNKPMGVAFQLFIRASDKHGNWETKQIGIAAERLDEILHPLYRQGSMQGDRIKVEGMPRSLTREGRIAFALNCGNEGNRDRLLSGYGINVETMQAVLSTLTTQELNAVQEIWDFIASYRPAIEAKERRVTGRTPQWVDPSPLTVHAADGNTVVLRGGYYPIRYDPIANEKEAMRNMKDSAQEKLNLANLAPTTRRSFTKARAKNVKDSPLLLNFSALYDGVQDIIHDLAWHEWLIDMNRFLRAGGMHEIKRMFGSHGVSQVFSWINGIAEGERKGVDRADRMLGAVRRNVSVASLGYQVVSAAVQLTGLIPAAAQIGPHIIPAALEFLMHPASMSREIAMHSDFMRDRERTRFRELNEIRVNVARGSSPFRGISENAYAMMMFVQGIVDRITWMGALRKGLAEGLAIENAREYADAEVIDTQGSGMVKDRSAIENGGELAKMFTVFYSFMGTAFNLNAISILGERSRYKAATQIIMLTAVLPVVEQALREAITLGGDDDEDDGDVVALMRKHAGAIANFSLGTVVGVREFASLVESMISGEPTYAWRGPAGLRLFSDTTDLATQINQGEFDKSLIKAIVKLSGDLFGLPAVQINRFIDGYDAYIEEGVTDNPLALALGYKKNK